MMKIWLIVWLALVIVGVVNADDAQGTVKTDHNKEEHERLCNVLKAAVATWGEVGAGLSEPLKKALGRTIFGKDEGGKVDTLKSFPKDYNDVGGLRGLWCGEPYFDDPLRWSGHSAPHDLVCLCTVGHTGWPLNNTGEEKLCGKTKDELGGNTEGWSSSGTDKGAAQILATWENVTKECLQSDGKGETLKEALNDFINKLVPKPSTGNRNGTQLGEGTPDINSACTGSGKYGVCVEYYPTYKDAKMWWKDLKNALDTEETEKLRKLKEEERLKKEEAEKQEQPKDSPLPSSPTTTNQKDKHRNDNLTDKLRKLNPTSGTLITPPSSWLLSVAFLI